MADPSQANRRMKTVQSARRSTELEGASSTAATRADQLAYLRGTITAAQVGDRVRQRYGVL
ncbi:antitoxin VbhA family protein [Mycolicibacterium mageritense]|jgi:antitoxin VbhA-like protein|uniref:antitoxin VbhA family protein n=1 Tax=Mycolicibacterium mageritense TaxID=53462 RepID=UPI001E308F85|nr:antitoxin VbhA family protein [Mycolicibacterium mageritense]MCC9182145.1 antitoxin VbhA family protein [Mycolicibacterium mageritense]